LRLARTRWRLVFGIGNVYGMNGNESENENEKKRKKKEELILFVLMKILKKRSSTETRLQIYFNGKKLQI
jgi:hypothetical protein